MDITKPIKANVEEILALLNDPSIKNRDRFYSMLSDASGVDYKKTDKGKIMKRRKNFKVKALPARIARTPRSAGEGLYVYPKTLRYPIGDLYHAREALIYVLSPTNASSRKTVAKAVQKAYPTYNWGAWWNSKRKGKAGVPTWSTLTATKNPKRVQSKIKVDPDDLVVGKDYAIYRYLKGKGFKAKYIGKFMGGTYQFELGNGVIYKYIKSDFSKGWVRYLGAKKLFPSPMIRNKRSNPRRQGASVPLSQLMRSRYLEGLKSGDDSGMFKISKELNDHIARIHHYGYENVVYKHEKELLKLLDQKNTQNWMPDLLKSQTKHDPLPHMRRLIKKVSDYAMGWDYGKGYYERRRSNPRRRNGDVVKFDPYVINNYPDFIDLWIRSSSSPERFLERWAYHCEETGIGCSVDQLDALIDEAYENDEAEDGEIFVGEWWDIEPTRTPYQKGLKALRFPSKNPRRGRR